jgi:hypothetical protein
MKFEVTPDAGHQYRNVTTITLTEEEWKRLQDQGRCEGDWGAFPIARIIVRRPVPELEGVTLGA